MLARCYTQSATGYKNYGGRGISVSPAWVSDFTQFLRDMGERPEGTSLERVDNELGYSKENCKWAVRKEQNLNKRNNRIVEVRGVAMPLSSAAELGSVGYDVIRGRLNRGWEPQDAVLLPKNATHAKKYITANGETHPVDVWASRLGMGVRSVHLRIQRGWSEQAAVTVQKDSTRRHRVEPC